MAQHNQFKPGDKAPNDGVYIEVGETGSMVKKPEIIEMKAGQMFPDTSNHNRIWMRKPKNSP
ncbi:YjzC family protein [Camelliibacillus cellulosilyticus]|uniref:YjzC family protein n=1 Tax=Camelliibacillus cellulosilyticus TaxID=2174486 RepID=A0ABV9GL47_9BACL